VRRIFVPLIMKTTPLLCAGLGANQTSCVKSSRVMRESHASPRHRITDSLALLTGIAGAMCRSMKATVRNLLAVILFLAVSLHVHAQGSLVYDQESATGPTAPYDIDFLNIQGYESLTQSFVPELSAIDFVQLEFSDEPNNGNNGATVDVNLYEGSPNVFAATLLATTTAVYMPNGFGETTAGVTTFDFSTAITLTPGQTYYLEPVVLSGDNPWDVMVLGDIVPITNPYPDGELYVDGSPYTNPIDFWFREGIVAVPEPTTLALIGFVCVLLFIFRHRFKLPVLMFATVLFTLSVLSVNAAGDDVLQATASDAGLTSVPDSDLPHTGTFYIATINSNSIITLPPYPILPTNMMDLPAYLVTNDIFILDDTKGQVSSSTETMSSDAATAAVKEQSQTVESLIEMIVVCPS
jgi:hypothetical protein